MTATFRKICKDCVHCQLVDTMAENNSRDIQRACSDYFTFESKLPPSLALCTRELTTQFDLVTGETYESGYLICEYQRGKNTTSNNCGTAGQYYLQKPKKGK